MDIIYLHGFQSGAQSIKGQLLKQRCEPKHQVYLPDLNEPPDQALEKVSQLISSLHQPVLVGSSLGGFYAIQLAARHALPAVLINPAMQPWRLFSTLFSAQLPYAVTDSWSLDEAQLRYLENMACQHFPAGARFLALLQQGDEILDWREAHGFFSTACCPALVIAEHGGSHGMDDFAAKIPMVLQFLAAGPH